MKPVHTVVRWAVYAPVSDSHAIPTNRQAVSIKLALFPPAHYNFVFPENLSTISEIESKRIYYGPRASLLLKCRLDEFVKDFGPPMPEVDVDGHSVEGFTSLSGLLAGRENKTVESVVTQSGPVTRSQAGSGPGSFLSVTLGAYVFASASLNESKFVQ